jgi:hypothetical protein
VTSDITTFIKLLQTSKLYAECPSCGEEFLLAKSLLFDGTKKFPEKAEEKRLELLEEIGERTAELIERQKKQRPSLRKPQWQ